MIVGGFNKRMDNLSYIVGTVSDHILEINGRSVGSGNYAAKTLALGFQSGVSFLYTEQIILFSEVSGHWLLSCKSIKGSSSNV